MQTQKIYIGIEEIQELFLKRLEKKFKYLKLWDPLIQMIITNIKKKNKKFYIEKQMIKMIKLESNQLNYILMEKKYEKRCVIVYIKIYGDYKIDIYYNTNGDVDLKLVL